LSTIATTANTVVGPRLRRPRPELPAEDIATAKRIAENLRRPTSGVPEVDALLGTSTGERPITGLSLLDAARGSASLLKQMLRPLVENPPDTLFNDPSQVAVLREWWHCLQQIPDLDPGSIPEPVPVSPVAPLLACMSALELFGDMNRVWAALYWLGKQGVVGEPEGQTLLDVVACAMPRDVKPNSGRRNPIGPSFRRAARIEDPDLWGAALAAGDADRAGQLLLLSGGAAVQPALPPFETTASADPLAFYDLAAAADPSRRGLQTPTSGAERD